MNSIISTMMAPYSLIGFLMTLSTCVGFFISAPVFSTRLIPRRVKITFVLLVALSSSNQIIAETSLITGSFTHLLAGIIAGFLIKILFIIFDLCGEMVANGMGLSFPGQISALSSQNTGPATATFQIFGVAIFISTNGLESMIGLMLKVNSLTPNFLTLTSVDQALNYLTQSMLWGIYYSTAIWLALFVANIGMLLASRLSGGLNLMSSAFSVLSTIGLVLLTLAMLPILHKSVQYILEQITKII